MAYQQRAHMSHVKEGAIKPFLKGQGLRLWKWGIGYRDTPYKSVHQIYEFWKWTFWFSQHFQLVFPALRLKIDLNFHGLPMCARGLVIRNRGAIGKWPISLHETRNMGCGSPKAAKPTARDRPRKMVPSPKITGKKSSSKKVWFNL